VWFILSTTCWVAHELPVGQQIVGHWTGALAGHAATAAATGAPGLSGVDELDGLRAPPATAIAPGLDEDAWWQAAAASASPRSGSARQ
jgi:hypothetical protein